MTGANDNGIIADLLSALDDLARASRDDLPAYQRALAHAADRNATDEQIKDAHAWGRCFTARPAATQQLTDPG